MTHKVLSHDLQMSRSKVNVIRAMQGDVDIYHCKRPSYMASLFACGASLFCNLPEDDVLVVPFIFPVNLIR